MNIIIDASIPYVPTDLRDTFGQVTFLKAEDITAAAVREADALVIRTRTRCDEALLGGSRVSFIATATIGFDHLDLRYLQQRGIGWANAPGCNASSVGQYVECALLRLAEAGHVRLDGGTTIGIVGVGHVGRCVEAVAEKYGLRILRCDPPRADRGEAGFVSLEAIAQGADVITFHTPLTTLPPYPTHHLADARFFSLIGEAGRRPVVINSSRGEVVETSELLRALDAGIVRTAVVDTWEGEPRISLPLLRRVFIGTPHIAGYSADGKARATEMALNALSRHFYLPDTFRILPPPLPPRADGTPRRSPLDYYDPLADDARLRRDPAAFEQLRSSYPLRREMA